MIKLKLRNPETAKFKTYSEDFVSGSAFRRVVAFGVKQETLAAQGKAPNELEQIDDLVELVASLFSSEEVNLESVYDGLPAATMTDILNGIISSVLGGEDEEAAAEGK
ncbi:phage tail assembly chaperone G [Bacillus sp. mrc49]|uniref:phage tail assembly chaperone G n=1 Tax=Bacillus sp. mrc49 TaxID=2054913 RepID=UPI000C27B927|nr:hypothetical protein [Bacillus sp. mrc49]PJN91217.1 hypothetical protein CVN76_06165 [Bacillus sp. mrc49]PJN92031.1 hypothetical protein CVN76_01615 [Bacillus sp. mrc49]